MSYLFIVNPVAGKNKGKKLIPFIERNMKSKGIPYRLVTTTGVREVEKIAQLAELEETSTIVAVGGDGTINEVLNGMVNSKKVLGIIPAGTGNDFSRTLKIPHEPEKALEMILNRNIKEIDLGEIQGKYFINFASIGLDAAIAKEANEIKSKLSGTYAYILAAVKKIVTFKSNPMELVIDGERMEKKAMMVSVCNGSYYGGGMKIAPKASVEDGYLDICVIKDMNKMKLLFLFPTIYAGGHTKYKEVEFYKGKNIKVCSKDHLEINADGEIVHSQEIEFKISNKKLQVIIDPLAF